MSSLMLSLFFFFIIVSLMMKKQKSKKRVEDHQIKKGEREGEIFFKKKEKGCISTSGNAKDMSTFTWYHAASRGSER